MTTNERLNVIHALSHTSVKVSFQNFYLLVVKPSHFPQRCLNRDRQYFCAFHAAGDLNRHYIAVHSVSRPYNCQMCDRQFTRLQYFKDHMNTHTGLYNKERDIKVSIQPDLFSALYLIS